MSGIEELDQFLDPNYREESDPSSDNTASAVPQITPGLTTTSGNSLTRELLNVYSGKPSATPEEDSARASVSSRQWSNREAKKEAQRFLTTPNADFRTMGLSDIWGNVLRAEGGYSNNPNDSGGETKFGISKKSYPNEDIRNMTADRAEEIFKTDFFDAVGGDVLLKINPGLAAHVADMAFNAGPKAAVKLMYDAVGLPRESQITPELLNKLNDSDSLIKDYSIARLKYYSSLKDAPTFIKGWTNRVSNLNKALNVKSGLNGAYRSAKGLDVDALVQRAFSATEQLAPRFKELDDQEIERLKRANEMLSPVYVRPSSKGLSSIGDVFKATYDAKYYTNTVDGMNELAARAAMEASDANRKALGDKFDKSTLEKLTFGLYGGVTSLADWSAEVKKFKEANPGVKLPYETPAQVYAIAQQKAAEIEKNYNSLDSGSFKDGVGASLHKLGHVIAGYLPGEILGSMSDRSEAALNVLPLPGATTAAGLAKGAIGVMLGTGALQTTIQPKRQELGLEGGIVEGAINTGLAGAGQAAVGTLTKLATQLWRAGSKDTAKEIFKTTERLKKAIKNEIPNADTQHVLREAEAVDSQAKELDRNPFGSDYHAKLKYEQLREQAISDILEGKPVREMNEAPVKVIDNTAKLQNQFKMMYADATDAPDFMSGAKAWTQIKKSLVNTDPKFQSTVPIEVDGSVPRFKTKEEVMANTAAYGDEYVVPEQAPDGTWYGARPAELEDVKTPTTRFDEGAETTGNVRGFAGSSDVELAKKYPDLVKVNQLDPKPTTAPVYKEMEDVLGRDKYLKDLESYGSTKLKDLDQRYTASLDELSKTDPNYMLDLGDVTEEGVSVGSVVNNIKEERGALGEMFNCMLGRDSAEGV